MSVDSLNVTDYILFFNQVTESSRVTDSRNGEGQTSIQANKVRLGMVGGGHGAFIGPAHLRAAALDGCYDLVAGAFSRDPSTNRSSGRSLGLSTRRVYNNWQSMLERERNLPPEARMEVLAIVTPNYLHAEIAEAALVAGFHVLSEKPAGTSLSEVRRLASALATSGRLYGIAYTYLGYPAVWQARDMVQSGTLGQIRKIYVEYTQGWLSRRIEAEGNRQAVWRSTPEFAGKSGCIADIGTHALTLAEFVTDHRVDSVCAELRKHHEERKLDDDGMVLFRTSARASGALLASQICTGETNRLSIRVFGDRGGLEWHQQNPNSLHFFPADETAQVLSIGNDHTYLSAEAQKRTRLPSGHPEGYLEAMANLYRDFALAVRGDGEITTVSGIELGLRSMAFVEAVLTNHESHDKWTAVAGVD